MKTKDKCKKSIHNGECCCNCNNLIELKKHPMNRGFGEGSILENCGYVCLNPEIGEGKSGMYFDHKHGLCECYYPKQS